MNVAAFRHYCLRKKGASESLPFNEDTFTFKVKGKIFALLLLDQIPARANLKCAPQRAIILRETWREAILPGWHMHKKHWNTVVIEALPESLLCTLIDHSYALVVSGLPQKLHRQLKLMS